MELSARAVDSLLERWPVARLATLGADGAPQLVPIVFARCGGALWSPIDGKPKAGGELARVRNVRARPQVSVLLDHYDDDWRRLWWLRIGGRASVVGAASPGDPLLASVCRALREKYPQYADVALFRDEALLLRIVPERIQSWCAAPAAR